MPKHYKDMMDELINKIDDKEKKEDAPANAVAVSYTHLTLPTILLV